MWKADGIIKRRGSNSTEEFARVEAVGVQWRDMAHVMARRELETEELGTGYYIDWIELTEIARIMPINKHVLEMVQTFKSAMPYEPIQKPEAGHPDSEPETERQEKDHTDERERGLE